MYQYSFISGLCLSFSLIYQLSTLWAEHACPVLWESGMRLAMLALARALDALAAGRPAVWCARAGATGNLISECGVHPAFYGSLKIISRGRSRLSFSASHWTFEGRFCCICDLLTLKVSPLSYYRGKEAVVPFPSRSWQL